MSAIKRPFEIKIINPREIRMGSPYNHCNIELVGASKITLPNGGWQDKYAWSDDSKYLVLIKWNFENNEPGFHLVILKTENNQIKESERIFGLPQSLSIMDSKIKINKFLYNKEQSSPGNLCCDIDQEFELIF